MAARLRRSRRSPRSVALVVTLVIAGAALSGCGRTRDAARAPACPRLVVPAYFGPRSAGGWPTLVRAGDAVGWIIMNPDSGPGRSRHMSYVRAVAQARRAGERVLGYVATGVGQRPSSSVLADVSRYRRWYGVTSIFFDEAPAGAALVALYARYVRAVHAEGGEAVLNPGTVPAPSYFSFADAVVTFEGSYARYVQKGRTRPQGLAHLPSAKIWNIVTAAPATALGGVMKLAAQRGIGGLYVTDEGVPNPYGRLPSYWSNEVNSTSSCRR